MSKSLHLPTRILKVYIEALTGFSHLFSPDGLINTSLSQGCITETDPKVEMVSKTYIPRTGKWVRGHSNCLGPAGMLTCGLTLSMNFCSSSWMIMLKKLSQQVLHIWMKINFYIIEPIYTLCNVLGKTVSILLSVSLNRVFPPNFPPQPRDIWQHLSGLRPQ